MQRWNMHRADGSYAPRTGSSCSTEPDTPLRPLIAQPGYPTRRRAQNALGHGQKVEDSAATAVRYGLISRLSLARRSGRQTLPHEHVFLLCASTSDCLIAQPHCRNSFAHKIDINIVLISGPMAIEVVQKCPPIERYIILLEVLKRK
jgi:hypothetical protein